MLIPVVKGSIFIRNIKVEDMPSFRAEVLMEYLDVFVYEPHQIGSPSAMK